MGCWNLNSRMSVGYEYMSTNIMFKIFMFFYILERYLKDNILVSMSKHVSSINVEHELFQKK